MRSISIPNPAHLRKPLAFVACALLLFLAFRLPVGAAAQSIVAVVLIGFAFAAALCAIAASVRRWGSVQSERRHDS